MSKRRKKIRIEVKIDKLLGTLRVPSSTRAGGPMKAKKGKHVKYDRNLEKRKKFDESEQG